MVKVKGTIDHSGPASFDYTVTTDSLGTSNTATVSISNILPVNDAPVVSGVTPLTFNEDATATITILYSDSDSPLSGMSCAILAPSINNVSVGTGCTCTFAGVCTVDVTGTANYFGSGASFDYTVSDGLLNSATVTANFTINAINDAPVANNISPANFDEDTQSTITLSYSDVEIDKATGCAIDVSALGAHVIETASCSCNFAGVCTVGVTGSPNYNGLASFTYTVTDGQLVNAVSNAATVSFTIDAINDAPVVSDYRSASSPFAMSEDVVDNSITTTYSDAENNAVTCTLGTLSNVTVSSCSCSGGVCSFSGVKGSLNYNGPASFTYSVTDGMAVNPISNIATAYLNITPVNDAPVLSGVCPTAAAANDIYNCSLTTSDPDSGDTKTWSLDASNTCAWAIGAIDSSSGVLSHLLLGQDQGACTLVIRVTDALGASDVLATSVVITLPETSLGISAPVVGAELGYSVAVSGDFTIAGKPFDGGGSGSATTFFYNGAWSEQALTLPTLGASDRFGESVAISGQIAVVGAPGDANNTGAIYIYRYLGVWGTPIKLTPGDGLSSDNFGHSVSISGETIVVGSYGNLGKGAAYVYRYMNGVWEQDQKLISSDGAALDSFGYSVAIFENTIAVGAPYDSNLGLNSNTGSVYIYRYNKITVPVWVQEAQLFSASPAIGDNFGYSVAISDCRALIGVLNKSTVQGANSGAAVVYHYDTSTMAWIEKAVLVSSSSVANDQFGVSVAISNDTLVVGSFNTVSNLDHGKAYYYHYDQGPTPSAGNWIETQTITDPSGAGGDQFGFSVAISDDRIVIGSPLKDLAGLNSATGYVLVKEVNPKPKIQKNPDPIFLAGSSAGYSVAVSGDTALVGAYIENNGKGAAYIYKFNGTSWVMVQRLIPTSVSYGSLTTGTCTTTGTCFGYRVALSGKTAVVSAHLATSSSITGAGTVYVFSYNENTQQWDEKNVLNSAPLILNNKFGSSVAISGDSIIVGAIGENDTSLGAALGANSGAAYIFRYNGTNWVQEQKLRADQLVDAQYSAENFGMSVSISGATAVVGASLDKVAVGPATAGSILIYHYEYDIGTSSWKWVAKQRLQAADAASGDQFGYSIASTGDTVVVGAYGKALQKGAAYVYSLNGSIWTQVQKLTETIDLTSSGRFGVSVAVSSNTILIGGNYDTVHSGAAYIFDYSGTTWVERAKIMDANGAAGGGAAGDNFGISVGLSGDTAVIGAYLNDISAVNAGAAYFLDLRKY
jgi:hypothetical protein